MSAAWSRSEALGGLVDPNAPSLPSDLEAAKFYHGLESKPILIARSDRGAWAPVEGPYTYVEAKVLTSLGPHSLNLVWDETVSVALESYFQEQDVQYTGMTPLRIGVAGQASPPAVVFMGVLPGSLTREKGHDVAIHCLGVLVQNNITDVHVQIRESEATLSAASLFKPAITANVAYNLRQPFSTSLGIPICNASTTHLEGTGGFYFTHSGKPGALFLLTARHVVFDPNTVRNEHYEYRESTGAPPINVMFLGTAAFDARVEDIKTKIVGQRANINFLENRSALADNLNEDEAAAERKAVKRGTDKAEKAIKVFEKLQKEVMRDWPDESKRIIGHVVLSPRLDFSVGVGRYTEDWAIIEIHPDMISKRNFVGNAIELGHVAAADFKQLMYPTPPTLTLSTTPATVSTGAMASSRTKICSTPIRGRKTNTTSPPSWASRMEMPPDCRLAVSTTSVPSSAATSRGQPSVSSREVAVLPRTSKSGPFSKPGDSGAGIVAGDGKICGVLTGGDGTTESLDIAYLTPIESILARMKHFGITANLFGS